MLQLNLDIRGEAPAIVSGSRGTFGAYFSGIMSFVMTIAVLLVFLYLIWGAIEWISAGGDSSKIQKGRDKIVQSIIGLIVLASTVVIFMMVQQLLGITIFNFGTLPTTGTPGPGTIPPGTVPLPPAGTGTGIGTSLAPATTGAGGSTISPAGSGSPTWVETIRMRLLGT